MNIVYLASSIIPSRSANSIHVMKMCQAFAKHGHEVTLVVPDRPDREGDADDVFAYYSVDPCFEIKKLPRPSLSSLGTLIFQRRAGRYAQEINADLAYGRSMFACYFASRRGIPTAFESHGPFTDRRFERTRRHFLGRLTRHDSFRGLVVISNPLEEYYRDQYPHLNDRILQVHDGADPIDDAVDSVELDDTYNLHAGYVGNLYRGRGIDLILSMARACPWCNFHIIGGHDEDVEYWKQESEYIENITFYGYLPPADLDAYRLAFDVLLAPYQPDLETKGGMNTVEWMSPLKVFEYMAAGKPIVCSDFPVLREVLTDHETAILCNPTDESQWITALETLAQNPLMCDELGSAAKTEVEQNYTWEKRAESIIEFVTHSEGMHSNGVSPISMI